MPQRGRHDPTKNLVGFVVGDVEYAITIGAVREISNPLDIVALPRAPAGICGVADFRGEVVPVIDMRARFGLPTAPPTRRTKWIVVDLGGRTTALVVDAVTDVFGGLDIKQPPVLGGGEEHRGIVGVTKHEGVLVFVLDVRRLRDLTDDLASGGILGGSFPVPALYTKGEP
jgi:purine-binding chemotaxis protein CheW